MGNHLGESKKMQRTARVVGVIVAGLALASTGCATKKYVQASIEETEAWASEEIDTLQSQVEDGQRKMAEHDAQIEEVSATANDALERAIAAGHLAEGKFLYEMVLSADKVTFGFDRSELSESARAALDEFAAALRSRNEDVYIEIQGHTDATGPERYNLALGEERAEQVRRYLSREHGLALHRMSVISYGESAPKADNAEREGRSANRRVALVVLK